MKLLKPVWVNHDGQPIFSVDIHPDGTKFATGGQGGDAGRVCLWNFGPVINEELEKKESVPKLLCQMDNHLACVNVVRWSQSGKYLASAGDDEIIMIWQISKYLGSSASSIFRGSANVEHWRCIATLRGHSGDILDLNWSPSDEFIASGSVDNNVIVWNARKFPEVVARLNGHNGFVKGVSWDPIGKYVASQSDDKSVKIWRTKDWKEETTVSEPFRDCGGTTHVLRLNWSPDGQFLVSAHAMNNRGSTAQIIEREGWIAQKDFVGHRKAVTCVRFNPNILTEDSNFYTLIALGSRDKSVSVWSTKNKRPTLVLHDLFQSSVLDLTWSKDGYSLLGCSRDGTVAFIQFEPEEIGKSASEEAKMAYLQKLYGKTLQTTSKETLLIEDPEILKVREELLRKQKEEEKLKQNSSASSNCNNIGEQNFNNSDGVSIVQNNCSDSQKSGLSISDLNKINKGPTDKQIETRMPNGRKRITPIFIPPQTDCDGAPMPFNASATFSTTEPDSHSLPAIPERSLDVNNTPKQSPDKQVQSTPLSLKTDQQPPKSSGFSSVSSAPSPIEAPKATSIDANQKTANNESNGESHSDTVLSLTSSSPSSKTPSESTEKRLASPDDSISSSSSAKKIKLTNSSVPQQAKVLNNKQVDSPNQTAKQVNGPTLPPAINLIKKSLPIEKKKVARSPFGSITKTPASTIQVVRSEERVEKASTPSAARAESRVTILPSLKIDKNTTISVKVVDASGVSKLLNVEVENNISNSSLSIVRALNQENDKVWEMILSSKICGIAACPNLVAVACSDSTLSVFNTSTGRRLHTPLTLDSLASKLNCYKHYLLVVTCKASVWLWDFDKHSVIVKNESLQPILFSPSNTMVVNTGITDAGSPVITISSGKSFIFDSSFGSWSLVANNNDLLNFFSDYKQMWKPDSNSYQLAILQSQNSLIKKSHNVFLSNSNLQRTGTLSFIDQQLSSAFVLGSSKEYRHWLITLAQFLTEQGIELRLRELCQFLLGPPFSSSESNWERTILGNDKHSLLREILAIVTSNLKLQRIYSEFKQQLDLISSSSSSSTSSTLSFSSTLT